MQLLSTTTYSLQGLFTLVFSYTSHHYCHFRSFRYIRSPEVDMYSYVRLKMGSPPNASNSSDDTTVEDRYKYLNTHTQTISKL